MTYPGFTRDYVLDELPSQQGWALLAAAIELDSGLAVERATDGYIAQDRAK